MHQVPMFDLDALMDIRKKADSISYYCLSKRNGHDVHQLKAALDHMSRALSMFAELEIQRMKDENISYDPQSYIKGRLNIAVKSVTIDENDSYSA
ncbi:hypothetical protein WAK64_20460 [Bacillus spongiae]|uniref:Uncharacterized protein n=1 Tax=Bacillus spongiae TaxID=2683610 RepID=A0ABU8HJR8_9BACI